MKAWSDLDALIKKIPDEVFEKNGKTKKQFEAFIRSQARKEDIRSPKIVFIGSSGVGKSSTTNKLFGTNLTINHTIKSSTKEGKESKYFEGELIKGPNGKLIVYDFPGEQEFLLNKPLYRKQYRELISDCDVVLWIVSALDWQSINDQLIFNTINEGFRAQLIERLVVGVNKVDLIHPNNWNDQYNLPSIEQERNMQELLEYVGIKLTKLLPDFPLQRIIGYSASKNYRLTSLFNAMLQASPVRRAWVLSSRQQIANWIDPQQLSRLLKEQSNTNRRENIISEQASASQINWFNKQGTKFFGVVFRVENYVVDVQSKILNGILDLYEQ